MFNVVPKSASMKDVAKESGYHISTVSLALRGDERISVETRARIEDAALKLQYRVHPVVSAWVSARRSGSPVDRHLALAYLSSESTSEDGLNERIYQSASVRAKRHGFLLSRFNLAEYSKNYSRLDRVLRTRSIQGIVLGPSAESWSLSGIDWDHYSLVSIGSSLVSPAVNRVVEDRSLRFERIFESLLAKGYERIGFAMVRGQRDVLSQDWLKSYLYLQHSEVSEAARLPVYSGGGDRFADWMTRCRPDVVLTDGPVSDFNFSRNFVPAYDLSDYRDMGRIAGLSSEADLGESAVDMLMSFVTSNQRGLPRSRKTVLIEPTRLERRDAASALSSLSECA